MSESPRSRPGVEYLLLGLVVVGALFAWLTRGSTPKDERPPAPAWTPPAVNPAATDTAGWIAHARKTRRKIPYDAAAMVLPESLCVMMAQARIGYALHDSATGEITDRYAVGDPETGAGDSTILEGIAHTASGKVVDFRCSGPTLETHPSIPYVEYKQRP